MTATNVSRLARAADHIDAVELSDGRWAHYAAETSAWYVVSSEELAELCDYLDHDDEQIRGSAYSHWCAGTSAEEMPEGWTPDTSDDVTPEDLTPGNYVRTRTGDIGRVLADLDCLSPAPAWIDRPEEWIAVAWEDGTRTACALSDIAYAGQSRP